MSKTAILIVEDEAIVAADLAGKLRQLGYKVAGITAQGAEAVALAERLSPHLVLMDIQLEGPMDGIETAQAIRDRQDVPVIYLTAHSDAATLSRAKLSGPFGYILKPFDERELATQIELALYKHQAERQLREQREWLRVTLTSIGDAVIATDAAGRISFLNPVAESLTGWKAEEAMDRNIPEVFRIVNEQTGQALEDPVARVLRERCAVALANHTGLVTRDGRTVPIEDSAAPILDAAAKVIGAVLVFHDVTEKRRAENALRASEQRLRWALQGSGGGAWNWDLMRDEGWWSQEMYDLWGVEPGTRMLLKNSLALVHEQDRERLRRTIEESISRCSDFRCEFRIRHAVRGERWMASYGRTVCDESGRTMRLLGISLDITEQKRAQEELERSNRELEQFAYVASHALQEPLRAIVGFLQLLQSRYGDQIDEKGRYFIERTVKAGHRMQTLIRDLLTLSRVHTNGSQFAPTDLNHVVKNVFDNLQSIIQEKDVEITCDRLPNLTIDASQIQRLFQNLITNAVRYNENPKPIIDIGCQEHDHVYHFHVKDNGIGISSQFYQRIFKVFQRLHTDREYPGTGLGLALCKKIVERHGGTIWVESQPHEGSTFYFTLPAS